MRQERQLVAGWHSFGHEDVPGLRVKAKHVHLAGACPYLECALAIREKALGPDHPPTVTVRKNLQSLRS
jgi:hypothetical protein